MAFDAHANFASSSVAVPPSPPLSGLSLTVSPGDGAKFPVPPFNATVYPLGSLPSSGNAEIVRVNAVSGDVLTVLRAQEGTTAKALLAGAQVIAAVTAKTLTDVESLLSGYAPGSVLFIDATGHPTQDNADLFWDRTNKRLGIGVATPSHGLSLYNKDILLDANGLTDSFITFDYAGSDKWRYGRLAGQNNLVIQLNAGGWLTVATFDAASAGATFAYPLIVSQSLSVMGATTLGNRTQLSGGGPTFDAGSAVPIYINYYSGTGAVIFWNGQAGAGATLASIGSDGSFYVESKLGIGTTAQANLHGTGSTVLGAANAAIGSASMGDSQVNVWLNEAGNALTFKAKYSDGTVKSGSIALA